MVPGYTLPFFISCLCGSEVQSSQFRLAHGLLAACAAVKLYYLLVRNIALLLAACAAVKEMMSRGTKMQILLAACAAVKFFGPLLVTLFNLLAACAAVKVSMARCR